ncbi:CDP-glucose 4,6-dehydratase [Vibrio fortis]|uniref:CDP-glucose 4,6-dehydratase n=1 Tax=Vibrio fortis TaxID=212667 RepID=A0A066UWN2_9VIBR|nr:CDP-glucose 4,6-dehydratase [Vibrio fortis]KDN28653.1 CDP-glucose 4,6-dehydratase [Vibrio fortis]
MFNNVYKDKTVLVTGHTGFKGSWLTCWLLKLGARVIGVSDVVPTKPSMFEETGLEGKIEHYFCDIGSLQDIKKIIQDSKPDFLFHLAAQPIVSVSYENPIETINTNVMGTANILESLRWISNSCTAIFITSDKCYENVEWEWGYKETDAIGGKDIYSGSKGAAEVIFHSYQQSFFNGQNEHVRLATGRAGNVIGGGDWAKDRIVVDCMRNWSRKEVVEIRSPASTRPWQHVLEPLSGYLDLGQKLSSNIELHGESFNFGPRAEQSRSVIELLEDLSKYWEFETVDEAYKVTGNIPFHEAGLLKLNCDKALFHLKWEACLDYKDCVEFVSEWYFSFYNKGLDMYTETLDQISKYEEKAVKRSIDWAI